MRKMLTTAVAALTVMGGVAATATSVEARPYDRNYRYHRGNDHGDAVVAGIAGLAIGAALAGSSRDRGYYRDGRYYDRGYYSRGYAPRYYDRGGYYNRSYYAQPPRYAYRQRCTTVRVWDPYYGRTVRERRCW